MLLTIILLAILLNLYIFNISILDLIKSINQLNANTNYSISLINYTNNNSLIFHKLDCKLDCEIKINKIIYFYNNISQFKNVYHITPIKIQKINKDQCSILFIKKPNIKNQHAIVKDKRIITLIQNNCEWYINNISFSML